MINNMAIGKAGELRVASELFIRGYEVWLSLIDSGADLIVGENHLKVQVKTARRRTGRWGNTYTWTFKSWRQKEGHYITHPLEGIDFAILWAVEDNIFYIIPANFIRGRYSIVLWPNSKRGVWSRYVAFKDNWDSLKSKTD